MSTSAMRAKGPVVEADLDDDLEEAVRNSDSETEEANKMPLSWSSTTEITEPRALALLSRIPRGRTLGGKSAKRCARQDPASRATGRLALLQPPRSPSANQGNRAATRGSKGSLQACG